MTLQKNIIDALFLFHSLLVYCRNHGVVSKVKQKTALKGCCWFLPNHLKDFDPEASSSVKNFSSSDLPYRSEFGQEVQWKWYLVDQKRYQHDINHFNVRPYCRISYPPNVLKHYTGFNYPMTSSASSATVERANYQRVKSVCIRSFSCPYFPTFGLESPYSVRMRENTDQKFFEYGHLPTFRYIKE